MTCDVLTFDVQCHILGIVLLVLVLSTVISNAAVEILLYSLDYKHSIAVYDKCIFTL